ncbi:MAG: CPBP family intramembrane metalloprotease, partial [Microlunatus sp.]|nr:CPBP family intramembrane metalloprotease [Microlunatus sp.]
QTTGDGTAVFPPGPPGTPGPYGPPPGAPGPYGPPPGAPVPYGPPPGAPVPYGPPAAKPWVDPMPAPGTEYHRFLATPRNRWWKGVLAILGFVLGYLIINAVVGGIAIGIDVATGRMTLESIATGAVEFTPALFLATNIGNALSIPLAMFLQWLVWRQPVRWLHSVAGVVRWRLFGRTALIVVPIWIVYMVVSAFAFPEVSGTDGTGGNYTSETVALLIIMLLTTPLQAAGEEYGARGLIMRSAGSWVASPVPGLIIATLVPSFVFMLAHGAGDPWLNVYYFFFGVMMSILAWRTGGLEAACVVHVVNNMMAFGITIAAGQEIDLDRSAGTGGAFMLLPMAVLAVVTAVLWLLSNRSKVQRSYQPGIGSPLPTDPATVLPGPGGHFTR